MVPSGAAVAGVVAPTPRTARKSATRMREVDSFIALDSSSERVGCRILALRPPGAQWPLTTHDQGWTIPRGRSILLPLASGPLPRPGACDGADDDRRSDLPHLR